MPTAFRALVAALLICFPGSALPAQDDRAREGHWSCYALTADATTYYTTGVWDGKAFMAEVSNAFAQELQRKPGYTGRVSCSRAIMEGSTLAKNQADVGSRSAQWRAAGKKVI